MPTNQSGLSPFTDTGTGAYDGPPAEVTCGAEHNPEPTGAVDGPPSEVTTVSQPEHMAKPTGEADGPPASVTDQDKSKAKASTKQVRAADVEDKAFVVPDPKFTKGRR